MKILVVDDEPLIRSVCRAVLERNNFVPILAQNGLEALAIFDEMQSDLALILADVSMPVMDGPTFIREVFKRAPKANVIMMTGFSPQHHLMPEDLKRLCSTIAKPFTPDRLLAAVKKCLK